MPGPLVHAYSGRSSRGSYNVIFDKRYWSHRICSTSHLIWSAGISNCAHRRLDVSPAHIWCVAHQGRIPDWADIAALAFFRLFSPLGTEDRLGAGTRYAMGTTYFFASTPLAFNETA